MSGAAFGTGLSQFKSDSTQFLLTGRDSKGLKTQGMFSEKIKK